MAAGRAAPTSPRKVGLWLGLIAIVVLAATGWWRVPVGLGGRAVARFTGATKAVRGGLVVVRLRGAPSTLRFQQAALLGAEHAAHGQAVREARLSWPGDAQGAAINLIQPALSARGGSAFAAAKPATGDAGPILAANLDSAALGAVEGLRPLVYLVSETGKIPYAGVGYPGLERLQVGVNQAGVAAAFIAADREPLAEAPTTPVAAILGQARTVDEAVAILRERPYLGPADLILADPSGPPVLVEMANGEVRVGRDQGGVVLAAGTLPAPYWTLAPVGSSGLSRRQRLTELTSIAYGALDLTAAIGVLRDRFDTDARRLDPSGDVIASEATVISAVVEPGAARLWVATGRPPASFGAFTAFSPLAPARSPAAAEPSLLAQSPAPIPPAPPTDKTYAQGQAAFDEAQAGLADLIFGRYASATAHYLRALAAATDAPRPKPGTYDPANVAPPGLGRLQLRLADARRLQGREPATPTARGPRGRSLRAGPRRGPRPRRPRLRPARPRLCPRAER
ncbi:MAG: C45 family peptidase [Bacillota bacterium]